MVSAHQTFAPGAHAEQGRMRSNTTHASVYIPSPPVIPFHMEHSEEVSRTRSSSWPRPPSDLNNLTQEKSALQAVQRSRSGGRTPKGSPGRKKADTPRKKRKRLNPQRRSFYKSLHNDFPEIADALREARQGADVVQTLKSHDISFTTIEARPPQDPTNLNVRRYNDTVFIWDPAMETWLQAPHNGEPAFGFAGSTPPDFPLQRITNSPDHQFSGSGSESHYFLEVDRTFRSDASTSDDDENRSRGGRMNGFLPTNLLNDVM